MPTLSTLEPHQTLLETQLPTWAHSIAPPQWHSLRQSQLPAYYTQAWFANAAPDLRQAVHRSQSRLLRSQAMLARSLKAAAALIEDGTYDGPPAIAPPPKWPRSAPQASKV